MISIFTKGQIVFYNHKNASRDSRAKSGPHLWVVLHSYTHPLDTYLIAPITSNTGMATTCIPIRQAQYPDVLTHDSYVDLRFITVVNSQKIQDAKGIDDLGNRTIILNPIPTLNPTDIVRVDLGAIMALELGDVIQGLVEKEKSKFVDHLKTELENNLQATTTKIEDAPTRELIQTLFNDLISAVFSKK